MKDNRKIKYWFTRNGIHIPVYETPVPKKVKKAMSESSGLRNPRVTQDSIFDSIDKLEQKAVKTDLSEAAIKRLYGQAQKHAQTIQEKINTAHPLEDTDKLIESQQRLQKIMKKLNGDYNNNEW